VNGHSDVSGSVKAVVASVKGLRVACF